jgi:hypothetical protein
MNVKSIFLFYVIILHIFVGITNVAEPGIYSDAMDSGEIPHVDKIESIQDFRRRVVRVKSGSDLLHHVPVENAGIVRLASRIRSILEKVANLLIFILVPTLFKLLAEAIRTSYLTFKNVLTIMYTAFINWYAVLRSEFKNFEHVYGIEALFTKIKSIFNK